MLARRSGQDITIEVVGELISKPYIEITLNLMARFGVSVRRDGWRAFTIARDAVYRGPGRMAIEGDASTASYFLALGAIGGGPVRVTGVGEDSIQGDVAFAATLAAMGADVRYGPGWIETRGVRVAEGGRLKAFDADFNLIPDAAMTAATLALYADGPCRLRNIGSWRVKETDRIHAMHTELEKLGAGVQSGADWLEVAPPEPGGWRDAHIGTWDDHRMAMCFSLAAFGPAAVRILDPGCVSKTFPIISTCTRACWPRGTERRLPHGYFRIRRRRAGHHHRRPHGFRQGHHRAPGSQAAGLGRARQRRPVPADRPGRVAARPAGHRRAGGGRRGPGSGRTVRRAACLPGRAGRRA